MVANLIANCYLTFPNVRSKQARTDAGGDADLSGIGDEQGAAVNCGRTGDNVPSDGLPAEAEGIARLVVSCPAAFYLDFTWILPGPSKLNVCLTAVL
jgi:hypothetical protein